MPGTTADPEEPAATPGPGKGTLTIRVKTEAEEDTAASNDENTETQQAPVQDEQLTETMASITQPPPFLENPGKPPVRWSLWRRKFTTYLEAMGGEGFSTRRKLSMLEHCLGTAGLDMLDHLPPAPQVGGQATDPYQAALGKLQRHFGEKTNILVERHHFITRAQRSGESAQEYLIALRTLAASCEYGNMVEDMIRDVFVGHTSNARIQEKCLMQDRLDLDQLEKIVERLEHTTARLQTMKIKEEPKGGEVQAIRPKPRTFRQGNKTEAPNANKGKGRPKPCYRCGSTEHIASDDACPAWDAHCSFCKKRGHYAKVCQAAREQKKKSCNVIEEQEKEDQSDELTCNAVTKEKPDDHKPRFVLQVNASNVADTEEGPMCLMSINGMKTWILIDSGSPYTMLNERTFQQIPGAALFPQRSTQPAMAGHP